MDKTSFAITRLAILKMPGFSTGIRPFDDLSPGINLMAGPNASGKSSVARAIQQLIWRQNTERLQVESSVRIGDQSWEIRIDARSMIVQRNGKNDTINGLPAFDESERYMLALDRLVRDDDKNLAKHIMNESIGGYDMDAAAASLQYSAMPANKGTAPFKNFEAADKTYKETKAKQEEVLGQEENLKDLRISLEEAEKATRLAVFYQKVIEYLDAKAKFEKLVDEKKNFPGILDKLSGEEMKSVERLEEEAEQIQQAVERIQTAIGGFEEIISALPLPAQGVDERILSALSQRIKLLTENEKSIRDLVVSIAGIRLKEADALKAIGENGEHINAKRWSGIDLGDVNKLDEFLKRAHEALSRSRWLEVELEALNAERDPTVTKSGQVAEGIRSLTHWLAEQRGNHGISRWWIIALMCAGLLTAVAIVLFGYAGLIGLLVIVIVGIFALARKKKNAVDIRQQDYNKTGLRAPDEWNAEDVTKKLGELVTMLHDATWQERVQQRTTDLDRNLKEATMRVRELQDERRAWVDKIKSVPAFPDNDIENFSGLYWFLKQVREWQIHRNEADGLEAEKNKLADMNRGELEKINVQLEELNLEIASDDLTAAVIVEKIKKDVETRRTHLATIDTQKELEQEKKSQLNKVSKEIEDIYAIAGIEENKKETLKSLDDQLAPYKKIKEDYGIGKGLLDNSENLLRNHGLYGQHASAIENLSIEEAKLAMEKYLQASGKIKDLTESIANIEVAIENQKQGRILEDALMKKDRALEDLRQQYENNLSSITGSLIVEQLKNKIGETNRPLVFKKANEIFNRITKHQYELTLDEPSSSFMGYDTTTRIALELEKLSSGTRIQLLLAVRLAFIETHEGTFKLPILADELLGNSDESRAAAIIEALTDISRDGRQIFYFTAQGEEIDRWKIFLDKVGGPPYRIFDVADNKNEKINFNIDRTHDAYLGLVQTVPDCLGKTHDEYARLLHVPSFNLITDECSQLHCWYLFPDDHQLYACLSKGLYRWGQLESFLKYGGRIGELSENDFSAVREKINFLNRFQRLFQQGRSRPIDREVLENSRIVSDTYIDAVAAKLELIHHDPRLLVASLRGREIPGFRGDKTDRLEEYFLNQGYISNQEVFSTEEILIQLQAHLSDTLLQADDADEFINTILQHE